MVVEKKPELDLTTIFHLPTPESPNQPDLVFVPDLSEKFSEEERATIEELSAQNAMLIMHRGPSRGSRFLLTPSGSSIGRLPENDIFLDDVTVSRKHAEISGGGAGVFILKDMGSLNGTYVNKDSVAEVSLTSGDEIQIGKFHMIFIRGNK